MGIHPAPTFANIYLAKRIDQKLIELGIKYVENGASAFVILKLFLDDILKYLKEQQKINTNYLMKLMKYTQL